VHAAFSIHVGVRERDQQALERQSTGLHCALALSTYLIAYRIVISAGGICQPTTIPHERGMIMALFQRSKDLVGYNNDPLSVEEVIGLIKQVALVMSEQAVVQRKAGNEEIASQIGFIVSRCDSAVTWIEFGEKYKK
jgi:hypothetical protein